MTAADDRRALTEAEREALFIAACKAHTGPPTFICRPCADAQDAVIERIVARHRAEAAAEALEQAADAVDSPLVQIGLADDVRPSRIVAWLRARAAALRTPTDPTEGT